MQTLKFRTNINCGGCIKAITPHFANAGNIKSWEVDTENPEKILTVNVEDLSAQDVKNIVEKAGFKATELT